MSVIRLDVNKYWETDGYSLSSKEDREKHTHEKSLEHLEEKLQNAQKSLENHKEKTLYLTDKPLSAKRDIIAHRISPLKLGKIYEVRETSGKTSFKPTIGKLELVVNSSDPEVLMLAVYPVTNDLRISQKHKRLYSGTYEFTETTFKEVDGIVTQQPFK